MINNKFPFNRVFFCRKMPKLKRKSSLMKAVEDKRRKSSGKDTTAIEESVTKLVKVGVLRPVQQPGSYWDRSSELPLVGLEPTEVTAYD